ncbi:MAG: DUF1330 domain-containing protein [Pseudomonadota bacterium]
MEVINALGPTQPSQIQEMMKPGPEGPIFMVNLLTFKEKAEYEDGRATDLTGREAYIIYADAVINLVERHGGRMLFIADVSFLPVGETDELWDEVAIALYPDRSALLQMSMSDEWKEIAVHRTAGLKGQLNIETKMPALGRGNTIMTDILQSLGHSSQPFD